MRIFCVSTLTLRGCAARFLAQLHRSGLMEALPRTASTFAELACCIGQAATEFSVQAPKSGVDRKAALHSALVIITLMASP